MFFKHLKWAFVWALIILILCGIPGREIPHISFLELLSFDKFVHASIFLVLVVLLIRGYILQTKFPFFQKHAKNSSLIISITYGGLLEIMQGTLFEDRSADIYDFIANTFGCIIGFISYSWIEKKFLIRFIKQ